jgi:hypothetical protein
MAKDEYLEISDLDTRSESDKVTAAVIYVTTLISVGAVVFFMMKMAQYGVGFLADK